MSGRKGPATSEDSPPDLDMANQSLTMEEMSQALYDSDEDCQAPNFKKRLRVVTPDAKDKSKALINKPPLLKNSWEG